jgi:hypothetical protein
VAAKNASVDEVAIGQADLVEDGFYHAALSVL